MRGKGTSTSAADLRSYSVFGHERINRALRAGESPDTAEIDAAIAASMTDEPMTIYRGIPGAEELFGDLDSLVGRTIDDPAFQSFSADRSVAVQFARNGLGYSNVRSRGCLIELEVPSGENVLEMGRDGRRGEHEHLLGRGRTLRITSAHREDRITVLEAELVG